MMFGLASWIINGQYNGVNPESQYQLALWAIMLRNVLLPPSENERQ